jgi:methionyl-tRNA formyltransferase
VRALRATLVEMPGTPGAVLDDHLTIACGEGAVRLTELQRAGKRPMPAEEFLRGVKLGPGAMVD